MSRSRPRGSEPMTIGLLNDCETDVPEEEGTRFFKPVVHGLVSTHGKMDAMTLGTYSWTIDSHCRFEN